MLLKKRENQEVLDEIGGRLEEAKNGLLREETISCKEVETRNRQEVYQRVENLAVSRCSYFLCIYESCVAAELQRSGFFLCK